MEAPKDILLPQKQRMFADCILMGQTQVEAYKNAGYALSKKKVHNEKNAARVFNYEKVQRYIIFFQEEKSKLLVQKTLVTEARTVEELSHIGFADPAQLFDEKGKLLMISKMPESIRRAISSIEVYESKKGNKVIGHVKKVRLIPKNDALKTISQYLGILTEEHHRSTLPPADNPANREIDFSKLPMDSIVQLSNMLKKLKSGGEVKQLPITEAVEVTQ